MTTREAGAAPCGRAEGAGRSRWAFPCRGNLDPLPPRQTLQAVGQFARLGHCRAVDKNGNDTNVAFERSLNLDPDKIIRIVETTPIVGAGSPVPSDDRDKRVTSADAISQNVEPINAKVDIVDIEEDVFAVQQLHYAIMDCARGERGLFSSIANEDAAAHLDALAPNGKLARNADFFQGIHNAAGRPSHGAGLCQPGSPRHSRWPSWPS